MLAKKVVIVGLGEVGSSWFKVVSENSDADVIGRDIKGNRERTTRKNLEGKTVLHVCMPFLDESKNSESLGKFNSISSGYVQEYNPDLVIVNTSAMPGTTRSLYDLIQTPTVHVPVRGVHPNIDKGIREAFVNFIGPIDDTSAKLAESYLGGLGIRSKTFNSPEETEIGKLLDTSYYGVAISFAKEVYSLCEKNGWDFQNVYTVFNQTYNEGYLKLGRENVVRPVLVPPQVFNRKIGIKDNRINGHCVVTNAQILKSMERLANQTKFAEYILGVSDQ